MKTLPDRPFNPRQDKTDRARLLPYGARNHPAKMNIALALDLVERYTRPGMHILDPCYGVGTTGVALLKGRHVTGIELEPHHHRDALANSKHLERISHDFGKEGGAVVILGDAREQIPWLVNHAKEAVITSGAFGEMNAPHRGGDITQRPTKDGKDFEGNKEQFVYGGHDQPQTDGTLFSVSVTSPAYSNQEVAAMDSVSVEDHLKRGEGANAAIRGGKGYGIPGVEFQAIVDSTLFSASVTSPAYSDQEIATTDNTQTSGGIGKAYRERGVRAEDILLGRDYQKIVDAHILSPAYGTQMPDQGDPQVGVERVKRKVESGELRTDNPGGVGRRTAWGGGQVRSYAYGYGADVGPRSVDYPGGPDTLLTVPEPRPGNQHTLHPRSVAERFWEKVDRSDPDGCWPWTGAKDGQERGSLRVEGKSLSAHRISYELAYGSIPEGMSVLHRCDVGHCVNPAHFFLGTQQDNVADQVAKGRQVLGERNGRAKLTEAQVAEIRERHAAGEGTESLAAAYLVHRVHINSIVSGKRWSHTLPAATITSPAYSDVASRDRSQEPYAQTNPERERLYGGSTSRHVDSYGRTSGQVGNMKLPEYQQAMADIYARCLDVTRPGGVLVTVTGNYISEGKIIDLAALTIDLCVAAGWTPVERWRAVKRNANGSPAVSFWRTIQAKQGMPLIDWEDILVFCRGEQPGWDFTPLSGGWPG